jgi:hypothetical protein
LSKSAPITNSFSSTRCLEPMCMVNACLTISITMMGFVIRVS